MNSRYVLETVLKIDESSALSVMKDEISGRKVVVRKVSLEAKRMVDQARAEAFLLSKLNEKGIPQLIDVIQEKDCFVVYRQWIEGESLSNLLKKKGLSFGKRKSVFLQIVHLIDAIHQQGYLYLDLKADNIIVSSQGQAYLCDLNSVIPIGSSIVQLSNPYAYPPEAKNQEYLDERSDQIGLAYLYKLLLGQKKEYWKLNNPNPKKRYSHLNQLEKEMRPLLSSRTRYGLLILMASFLIANVGSTQAFWSESGMKIIDESWKTMEKTKSPEEKRTALEKMVRQKEIEEWALQNPSSFQVLVQRVIESQNSELCRSLYQRISVQIKEQFPIQYTLITLGALGNIQEKDLDDFLDKVSFQSNKATWISILCTTFLIHDQVISQEVLTKIFSFLDKEALQVEQALQIAQYFLFWQAVTQDKLEWPFSLYMALQKSSDGKKILEFYEKSF